MQKCDFYCVSLVAQLVKNPPAMLGTWLWSLGWEDPLEKWKATHSSILAWRSPWTIESMGSQRVGHDWVTYTLPASWEICMQVKKQQLEMDMQQCKIGKGVCQDWLSGQEYWSEFPCPPPGDLPDPGIEPTSLYVFCLSRQFFTTSATWEAHDVHYIPMNYFFFWSLYLWPPAPHLDPFCPPSHHVWQTSICSLYLWA